MTNPQPRILIKNSHLFIVRDCNLLNGSNFNGGQFIHWQSANFKDRSYPNRDYFFESLPRIVFSVPVMLSFGYISFIIFPDISTSWKYPQTIFDTNTWNLNLKICIVSLVRHSAYLNMLSWQDCLWAHYMK